MSDIRKNQLLFLLYFALSAIITWGFVAVSPLYISKEQMLLSIAIAGGKWALQIVLALLFLYDKTWEFLKNIGIVCLIGSCILLPYALFAQSGITNSPQFFIGSLISAVLVMIPAYRQALLSSNVTIKWWYFWLLCLAVAITLQLTVVFHVL